jgi:RimJ/RimL family protein N-acetyltransferase
MPDYPVPSPTARLEFRWWTGDDLPLALLLWGDPEVMRYMGGPETLGSAEERLALQLERRASHGVQYWQLWLKPVGAHGYAPEPQVGEEEQAHIRAPLQGFVGCCGLKPPPERYGPGVLETGFHLRPPFWRQGYGEEAARAVIAHAFDVVGVAALFAGRHPDNVASGNLLAKLGFRPDGAEFFPRTGLMHPAYLLRKADR